MEGAMEGVGFGCDINNGDRHGGGGYGESDGTKVERAAETWRGCQGEASGNESMS